MKLGILVLTVALALALAGLAACGSDEQAAIDAAAVDAATLDGDLRCAMCSADQICVQVFDGTCGELALRCVARTPECPAVSCSDACNRHLCQNDGADPIFTCQSGGCPAMTAGAQHCFGP